MANVAHETAKIFKEVTGTNSEKTPFDLARSYYRILPNLMASAAARLEFKKNPDYFSSQLKRSPITAEKSLIGVVNIVDEAYGKPEIINAFLAETLPGLLSVATLSPENNESKSINLALCTLANQACSGRIDFFSPLCPPYHYKVTDRRRNYIAHASGQLLPTIGARFPQVLSTLGIIVKPMVDQGAKASWTFGSYSGQTSRINDLVELGKDVLEYYGTNDSYIFDALRTAYHDLSINTAILNNFGIKGWTLSIEREFSGGILGVVNQFKSQFPEAFAQISPGAFSLSVDIGPHNIKREVSRFMKSWLSADIDFLIHFIQEEVKYRELQHVVQNNGILIAALKESLLYRSLINYTRNTDKVLFGLETTSNYMKTALAHLPGPVMMGREFDARDPESTIRVRQPFNYPEGY